MPRSADRARRVAVEQGGPVLVEGPVEIVLDDGRVARSDRFTVAVCTCRRSRVHPWCDTSHRRRTAAEPAASDAPSEPRPAAASAPPGGADADAGVDAASGPEPTSGRAGRGQEGDRA